jgi:hypothetical protein
MNNAFRGLIQYGLISGALVGGVLLFRVGMFDVEHVFNSRVAGYAVMLAAFVFIYIAVRRHRDEDRGGVIGFWRAFGAGALVAGVASLVYTFAWELYYFASGGAWMQTYSETMIAEIRNSDLLAAERDAQIAQMERMVALYDHFWFRIPITLSEILPFGLLVALASAGLLRSTGPRAPAK